MKKKIFIGFLFFYINGICQDSLLNNLNNKKCELSGYVKELLWARVYESFPNVYITNLVHSRLNFKWKPSEKITGRLELRNRFYWGDDVRLIPQFEKQLRNQNEAINLSTSFLKTRSVVLHSNIERLWMEYRKSKWNIRLGRQRINWGINNTWNPNDLFNVYNFLDFDYEERPGSDALKFQYLTGELSNIELALAATDRYPIVAVKYFTNYKQFDLQAMAGIYQNVFTAGFGWAGRILNVGFKGETQFYADTSTSLSHFVTSIELDYLFKKGWYISSALLYNQKGLHENIPDKSTIVFEASPRNLMPARWNILLCSTKEFTPRFNAGISMVYAPQVNFVILFPSFRYNLKPNLDIDFVWQSLFADIDNFHTITQTAFVRLKWSFASRFRKK